MFVIKVKNKSQATIVVPLSSLVPVAREVTEQAAPEAEARCSFEFTRNENAVAQDAIRSWATATGVAIEIAIEVVPPTIPASAPGPGTTTDPSNPLGL